MGDFTVVVVPTPHTPDHRSYRIHWRDVVMYFVGDTEDPTRLREQTELDLLFVTPWLSCNAVDAGGLPDAARRIAYHMRRDRSDRICGGAEPLPQGTIVLGR